MLFYFLEAGGKGGVMHSPVAHVLYRGAQGERRRHARHCAGALPGGARRAGGNGQLGRAEGRGPPLRLAVRPAQQGVHAVPLGGEGPAEVPAGGPPGQPVRARLLQED